MMAGLAVVRHRVPMQNHPERPSYTAAARADARARIWAFFRDGFLAGFLAFFLPAVAATGVYYFAERSQMDQAIRQFQSEAEFLAGLLNSPELGLAGPLGGSGDSTSGRQGALLSKAQKSFPAWSPLFIGRLERDQVRVLEEARGENDLRRSVRSAGEVASLAEALKDNFPTEGSASRLSSSSLLRRDPHVWSLVVPLRGSTDLSGDFLYLETSREPVMAELAFARDVRDMAIGAAVILGLVTAGMVFFLRYRSFVDHATGLHKIRESESLFRSTYERSPVAMALSDPNGRILQANRAFCRFLGYEAKELLKLLPSDYTRSAKSLGATVPAPLHSNRQVEQRYRHKDGQTVWGLVSTAVVQDARQQVSHVLSQVVDITERKTVEETLRLSEERLALAANAGGIGMWDLDLKTGEVFWNLVMHSIHQTDADVFVPTFENQWSFVAGEDRVALEEEFRACLETGRPFIWEYRIKDLKGELHDIKAHAHFIREPKCKATRAVGTLIDITADKTEAAELIRTREAALAADKAKSEFLAIMSHEIRTPLNGVLGFTSLLRGTPLNAEQRGYLETMDESGHRLINLVNDILDLSKIEAGAIRIEPATYAIRPFLQQLHDQFRNLTTEKNLQYELLVDKSVPEAIHTDPHRLGQILTNLLGNAVKFTTKGRVRFRVWTDPLPDQWEWHFSIEDTGPGIAPEIMPNLFQAFYQVDSSNTRRHGGTGLGLAITRRFAKRLGGHLVLRSEVDEGSEFTFILPAPRVELSQAAPDSPDPSDPATRLAGKRILVVEDNAVNRKLCGLQLKRLRCEVEFAETGLSAVEQATSGDFDAILMDIQLPDIDGHTATHRIRAAEKGGDHVAIIALTANAMAEDRQRCLDSGMDDFLSKPLKFDLLAKTLARWVDGDGTVDGQV